MLAMRKAYDSTSYWYQYERDDGSIDWSLVLEEWAAGLVLVGLLAAVVVVGAWYIGVHLPEIATTPQECAMARAAHYNDFVAGLSADVPPEVAVKLWMASDRTTAPGELPRVPECRHVVRAATATR